MTRTTRTRTPGTGTTTLAGVATAAAVLAGTAMLGTAAAYATVVGGAGTTPAERTQRTQPTSGRTTDDLEPVRLHRVYRVPFAQLAATGGR